MYNSIKRYFLVFTILFWGYSITATATTQTRTETEINTETKPMDATTTRPDAWNDRTDTPPENTTEVPPETRTTVRTTTTETNSEPNLKSGFYIEPGVTYESLNTNINWPTPFSNSSGSVQGAGLMARLGFHANQTIFLAFDGRYVKPTFIDSSTSVNTGSALYDYGPVLGAQVPYRGMRVWGQYVMNGALDSDVGNNLDYRFDNSQGYRVGAGFHVQAISINLEYQDLTYDTQIQSGSAFAPDISFENADLVTRGLILSLTFPFSI